ncbi:MAG: GNAT family protein, partial [Bacteroidia bacterium]
NMQNFPELLTERLRIGKIRPSAIAKIVEYANNKTISDNTLTFPYPYYEENAIYWINFSNQGFLSKENFVFAIYQKDTERFIGGIGLHLDKKHNKAELGYWIAEPFWNKGFATEAGKEILRYGFEVLNLNKIYATHFLYNPASEKILLKIGMKYEADLKEHYFKNGKYEDVRQYYLLKNSL